METEINLVQPSTWTTGNIGSGQWNPVYPGISGQPVPTQYTQNSH